ncbi:hypothetical protein [Phytobacter sp. MRY16-398]|uniref:hypothetical protein n=1 Tax=Phytobacter sp. MRY16-398 TaxID=2487150 RepID=UPI000DF633CF|nr:hypothetical protein [Phytobacter sp. MRY16-398]BBE77393.1 hypothetical protein MRY16398_24490 [Phytobacter sp. MRY16-398]
MKLKEILVQKLPKMGGWPEDVHALVQNSSGCVYQAGWGENLYILRLADDWMDAEVTREQYEAALAASQKVEWDGSYPIKPGTDVDVHFDGDDSRVWTEFRVEYMRGDVVVLHDYRSDDVGAYSNRRLKFRPIRSEADKKRDEAIRAMHEFTTIKNSEIIRSVKCIYDAIAAGKIHGVRIE